MRSRLQVAQYGTQPEKESHSPERPVVPATPRTAHPDVWPENATSYAGGAGDAALDALTIATEVAARPRDAALSAIGLIRATTVRRFSRQPRDKWGGDLAAGTIKSDYADASRPGGYSPIRCRALIMRL